MGDVCQTAYAQGPNLVPNPSFELYDSLPRPAGNWEYPNIDSPYGLSCIMRGDSTLTNARPGDYLRTPGWTFVKNWFRGNSATSDYYHRNAVRPNTSRNIKRDIGVNVPRNYFCDSLEAHSGDAYAGILTTKKRHVEGDTIPFGLWDYHEYLAVKLLSPLFALNRYAIKFRYAFGSYYKRYNNPTWDDDPNKNAYYLKSIGVAFLENTNPLLSRYGDSTVRWLSSKNGDISNTLEFDSTFHILVNDKNIAFDSVERWHTFEDYFYVDQENLQYMVIGNFQQALTINDFGDSGVGNYNKNDTTKRAVSSYMYIDDVEVWKLSSPSDCQCESSIRTIKKSRNTDLENTDSNKCCFAFQFKIYNSICPFRYMRVVANGQVVSIPNLKDFGETITGDTVVNVSFCIDYVSNDSTTFVNFEFLKADSSIVCVFSEDVNCHCRCNQNDQTILPFNTFDSSIEKLPEDSTGQCCWQVDFHNSYYCTFLSTDFIVETKAPGAEFTALGDWNKTILSDGRNIFASSSNLLHHSTVPVFKVCVPENFHAKLEMSFRQDSSTQDHCKKFPDKNLYCSLDTNCCDLLEALAIGKSAGQWSGPGCLLEFNVRNTLGLDDCKIFSIRIKNKNGTTVHQTPSGEEELDLSTPRTVWDVELTNECPTMAHTGYAVIDTFAVEFLDSAGMVLCSKQVIAKCCYVYKPGDGLEKAAPDASIHGNSTPLPGGEITSASLLDNVLSFDAAALYGDSGFGAAKIINLHGKTYSIQQIEFKNGSARGEFDVSSLPNGAYYLTIALNGWMTSKHIVILR